MSGRIRLSTVVRRVVCGMAVAVVGGGLAKPADAQLKAEDIADRNVAIVTTDGVLVRSGAHSSYYPFGRLKAGDPVLVVGVKDDWARVQAVGPAFDACFGFIRYGQGEAERVRIEGPGSATIMGRTDVLAPNLNTNSKPGDSWKSLVQLNAGQRVTVVETMEIDRETVHKVMLPPKAIGWVALAELREPTPSEGRQWQAIFAGVESVPPVAAAAPPRAKPKADPKRPAARPAPEAAVLVSPPVETANQYVLAREEPSELLVIPPAIALPQWQSEQRLPDAGSGPDQTGQSPRRARGQKRPASTGATETPDVGVARRPEPAEGQRVTAPIDEAGRPSDRPSTELDLTLDDLEAAFVILSKEDIESAEVAPLRQLYIELAAGVRSQEPSVARYAEARAEQLAIWSQVQQRRQELNQIRARAAMAQSEARAYRVALEERSDYVAVGRVRPSSIYNGNRLPQLLRLQDPGTGRTIAYLIPDGEFELLQYMGQLIGIVGTKQYDGGLRLNLIKPERIEPLTSIRDIQGGAPDPVVLAEPLGQAPFITDQE